MDTKICRKCNIEKPLNRYSIRHKTPKLVLRHICKDCTNPASIERHKKWKKTKKGREWLSSYNRNYSLNRYYGLTEKEYLRMCENQNHKCKICKTKIYSSKNKKLVVDHCHKTGKIRGLLCNKCNPALGAFRDSVLILRQAIKYLMESKNLTADPQVGYTYGEVK